MPSRREFLKSIIAGIVCSQIPVDITPVIPTHLLGIPYHYNDATTRTWLGIDRAVKTAWISKVPASKGTLDALIELIRKIQINER